MIKRTGKGTARVRQNEKERIQSPVGSIHNEIEDYPVSKQGRRNHQDGTDDLNSSNNGVQSRKVPMTTTSSLSSLSSHSSITSTLPRSFSPELLLECLHSFHSLHSLLAQATDPQELALLQRKIIRDVRRGLKMEEFNEGDDIYRKGEEAKQMFVVIRGKVGIWVNEETEENKPQNKNESEIAFQHETNNQNTLQQQQGPQKNHSSLSNSIPVLPNGHAQEFKGKSSKNSNYPPSNMGHEQIMLTYGEKQFQNNLPENATLCETVLTGYGFGQAEFLSCSRRQLTATALQPSTLIGRIDSDALNEVIQSYKQRVYYIKVNLFHECLLLKTVHRDKVSLIAGMAKETSYRMGQVIVREGQIANKIILIHKGSVELRKINCHPITDSPQPSSKNSGRKLDQQISEQSPRLKGRKSKVNLQDNDQAEPIRPVGPYRSPRMSRLPYLANVSPKRLTSSPDRSQNNPAHIIILCQGSFIGDAEVCLRIPYSYTVVCTSHIVETYQCEAKVFLAQLNKERLENCTEYYQWKCDQRLKKETQGKGIIQRVEKQMEENGQTKYKPTPGMLELKKAITRRYVEKKKTLIGSSAPRDIQKMVEMKAKRFRTTQSLTYKNVLQGLIDKDSQERQYARNKAKQDMNRIRDRVRTKNNGSNRFKTDGNELIDRTISRNVQNDALIRLPRIPHSAPVIEAVSERHYYGTLGSLEDNQFKSLQYNPSFSYLEQAINKLKPENIEVPPTIRGSKFLSPSSRELKTSLLKKESPALAILYLRNYRRHQKSKTAAFEVSEASRRDEGSFKGVTVEGIRMERQNTLPDYPPIAEESLPSRFLSQQSKPISLSHKRSVQYKIESLQAGTNAYQFQQSTSAPSNRFMKLYPIAMSPDKLRQLKFSHFNNTTLKTQKSNTMAIDKNV